MKTKRLSFNTIMAFLAAFILLAMLVRIIWVNVTYPDTDINIVTASDTLNKKGYSIRVLSAANYTRNEWNDRIKQVGVQLEEDAYNIRYYKMEKLPDTQYQVLYNPEEDYNVVELNVEIKNTSDKELRLGISDIFNLEKNVNAKAEHINNYYTSAFNKKIYEKNTDINIAAGESEKYILVYVSDKYSSDYYIQSIEIGNYQVMKLSFTKEYNN